MVPCQYSARKSRPSITEHRIVRCRAIKQSKHILIRSTLRLELFIISSPILISTKDQHECLTARLRKRPLMVHGGSRPRFVFHSNVVCPTNLTQRVAVYVLVVCPQYAFLTFLTLHVGDSEILLSCRVGPFTSIDRHIGHGVTAAIFVSISTGTPGSQRSSSEDDFE